jgi:hypothetical protein
VPDVPRQVSTAAKWLGCLLGLAWLSGLGAGCATTERTGPPVWEEQARYADAAGAVEVALYGDLGRMLPTYEEAAGWERFLYGPERTSQLRLRNAVGVALHGRQLLVCDPGYPAVVAIDLDTGRQASWTRGRNTPRCPTDVAVDTNGDVYVADPTWSAVLRYSPDGVLVERLCVIEPPGMSSSVMMSDVAAEALSGAAADEAELASPRADKMARTLRPCAVAVHGDTLFVACIMHHEIARYDLDLQRWVASWSPPEGAEPLAAPTGLACQEDGTLLIADAMAGVVRRVSSDGVWLESLGKFGRLAGELVRPKRVACLSDGTILVVDAGRQSLVVFDSAGVFQLEVPAENHPDLLAVDGWPGWTLPGAVGVVPTELLWQHAGLGKAAMSDATASSAASADAGPGAIPKSGAIPEMAVLITDVLGPVPITVVGWNPREAVAEPAGSSGADAVDVAETQGGGGS